MPEPREEGAHVIETGTLKSKDGTELHTQYLSAPDARAVLVILHGYGDHCGRFVHVMERFAQKGFDTASFDYRGHGKAGGKRGHVGRFSEYVEDLDAFLTYVLGRSSAGKKLYLVGHSHGGLVAASYVLQQPEGIDGLILSSPLLGFKLKIPAWKNLLGKGMSAVWPTLSIPTGIPPEHLSHDPAIVTSYANDPLVGKGATSRWYTEAILAQQAVMRQAHRIQLPVLCLQAGEDLIVDADATQNFVAAVGSADKEIKWYEGLYHEIFNEPRREDVFGDIDVWLARHL